MVKDMERHFMAYPKEEERVDRFKLQVDNG